MLGQQPRDIGVAMLDRNMQCSRAIGVMPIARVEVGVVGFEQVVGDFEVSACYTTEQRCPMVFHGDMVNVGPVFLQQEFGCSEGAVATG